MRFATCLAPDVRSVRRFVAVADADDDDIRAMARLAREARLEGFGPLAGCEPSSDEEGSR